MKLISKATPFRGGARLHVARRVRASPPRLPRAITSPMSALTRGPTRARAFTPGVSTASTGKLTPIGLVGETASPSFLAVHPNHKFLYAVNEISNFEGKRAGSVSAFAMDTKTGQLKLLNTVSSSGDGPCHLGGRSFRQMALRRQLRRRQRGGIPHQGRWLARRSLHLRAARRLQREQAAPVRPARARDRAFARRQIGLRRRSRAGPDSLLQGRRAHARTIRRSSRLRRAPVRATWPSRRTASSPTCMTEMTASVVAFKHAGGKFEELQTLPAAEMRAEHERRRNRRPSQRQVRLQLHSRREHYRRLRHRFRQGHADAGGAHTLRRQDAAQFRDRSDGRLSASPPTRIPITWWSSDRREDRQTDSDGRHPGSLQPGLRHFVPAP